MMNFSYYLPTKILFGFGALKGLGEEVENLGARKALLVTDKVMEKTGIVSKVSAHLDGLGYDISDEAEPEPRVEVAEAVARKARSSPDDLVSGLGAGSPLDVAKVAAGVAPD